MSSVKQKIRPFDDPRRLHSDNVKKKEALKALRAEAIARDNMRHRNIIYLNEQELGCCVPYESVVGLTNDFKSIKNHARILHKSSRYR
jgi:hypothetical protein